MKASLSKVLQRQVKTAVGFGGFGLMPNPVSWIGTESGDISQVCPDKQVWSRGSQGYKSGHCGSPNSSEPWLPKTCDTTLQNGDHWFWTPPATAIRNLETMKTLYHNTVQYYRSSAACPAPPSSDHPLLCYAGGQQRRSGA